MKQIIQYLYNVHFFYVLISDKIVKFQEQEHILIWFNSVDERRCRNEHQCMNPVEMQVLDHIAFAFHLCSSYPLEGM